VIDPPTRVVVRWRKQGGAETGEWRCPHCNAQCAGSATYKCYCGRVENPEFNPYLTPHSCGGLCGRGEGTALPLLLLRAC
jgi:hypothetical protein